MPCFTELILGEDNLIEKLPSKGWNYILVTELVRGSRIEPLCLNLIIKKEKLEKIKKGLMNDLLTGNKRIIHENG